MLPHERTFTQDTLTLERMKVAARAELSPNVAASVQFDEMRDHMTDRLIYGIRAEVMAERVLDTDAAVAFSGTRIVDTGVRVRGLVLPFLLAAAMCIVGVLVSSLPLVLGAGAVAAVAAYLLYLNPAEEVTLTVPVDGTVTVPATYWRKFPEATVVYPRELGGPVRFAIMGTPDYRAFDA